MSAGFVEAGPTTEDSGLWCDVDMDVGDGWLPKMEEKVCDQGAPVELGGGGVGAHDVRIRKAGGGE